MDNKQFLGKKLYIRTDGNKEIATGHIMRCLSIARACIKEGALVTFLVADSDSETLLQERITDIPEEAITITKLQTDFKDTEEELPLLCQILMSYPCDYLLIDSYFVNPGYLETLSHLTKVAYIDDVYAFPYPVNTVINYAPMANPDNVCYQLATQKLLGISYAPVREAFLHTEYKLRPEVNKILLTAGGIHNGKCYLPILDNILAFYAEKDLPEIHILLGAGENTAEDVKEYLENHPALITHGYINDMAAFLCDFDLVFAAAGTTLYELCALGIPTCSFISADNQVPSALDFEGSGLIPCLGNTIALPIPDSENVIPVNTQNIHDRLFQYLELASDFELRKKASAFMTRSLDKKGASRICEALLK